MGVNNLWKIVESAATTADVRGKRLAIDTSIWMCQMPRSSGLAYAFTMRVLRLVSNGIRPVFVFDGSVPPAKRETFELRKRNYAEKMLKKFAGRNREGEILNKQEIDKLHEEVLAKIQSHRFNWGIDYHQMNESSEENGELGNLAVSHSRGRTMSTEKHTRSKSHSYVSYFKTDVPVDEKYSKLASIESESISKTRKLKILFSMRERRKESLSCDNQSPEAFSVSQVANAKKRNLVSALIKKISEEDSQRVMSDWRTKAKHRRINPCEDSPKALLEEFSNNLTGEAFTQVQAPNNDLGKCTNIGLADSGNKTKTFQTDKFMGLINCAKSAIKQSLNSVENSHIEGDSEWEAAIEERGDSAYYTGPSRLESNRSILKHNVEDDTKTNKPASTIVDGSNSIVYNTNVQKLESQRPASLMADNTLVTGEYFSNLLKSLDNESSEDSTQDIREVKEKERWRINTEPPARPGTNKNDNLVSRDNQTFINAQFDDSGHSMQKSKKVLKDILEIFNIPFIDSPMEADSQCGYLYREGLVDGVITEDSDVLVHKATVYRHFFRRDRPIAVYMPEDVAKAIQPPPAKGFRAPDCPAPVDEAACADPDRLIKLAYLLGCDYCLGSTGVKTALKTAANVCDSDIQFLKGIYENSAVQTIRQLPLELHKIDRRTLKRFLRYSGVEESRVDEINRFSAIYNRSYKSAVD